MDIPTAFSARLKWLRASRGWTARELAQRATISYQAISRMENGHYEPSLIVAVRLADALDISLDLLAGRRQ